MVGSAIINGALWILNYLQNPTFQSDPDPPKLNESMRVRILSSAVKGPEDSSFCQENSTLYCVHEFPLRGLFFKIVVFWNAVIFNTDSGYHNQYFFIYQYCFCHEFTWMLWRCGWTWTHSCSSSTTGYSTPYSSSRSRSAGTIKNTELIHKEGYPGPRAARGRREGCRAGVFCVGRTQRCE